MATSMKVRLFSFGHAFQARLTATFGHFCTITSRWGTLLYILLYVIIATLSPFVVAGGRNLWPLSLAMHAEFLAEPLGHCIRQDWRFPVIGSVSWFIVVLVCLVGRSAPGAPTNLWPSSLAICASDYLLVLFSGAAPARLQPGNYLGLLAAGNGHSTLCSLASLAGTSEFAAAEAARIASTTTSPAFWATCFTSSLCGGFGHAINLDSKKSSGFYAFFSIAWPLIFFSELPETTTLACLSGLWRVGHYDPAPKFQQQFLGAFPNGLATFFLQAILRNLWAIAGAAVVPSRHLRRTFGHFGTVSRTTGRTLPSGTARATTSCIGTLQT